jgi:two-component system OmpR family response regulator
VLHHAHIGAEAGRNALLSAALAGQLSQFGLATLLTVLELERKTGVLTLERQGELASLLFKDGRLVGAEKKSAADSVFELLSWTSGRFAFSEQVVEAPAEAGTSPGVLLMEAARRMDELIPILEE